jgi:hypothetical protein
MNPYLEQFWGDVHHSLIIYARDQLQGLLPKDLRARVQERVFVESPGDERSIYPDVRIVERGRMRRGPVAGASAGIAVAEPLTIRVPDDPINQGYIEILDLATKRRVVTVIEVLSPSNKVRGKGRSLYLKRQQECRTGGVNLVEVDLLRDGRWTLSVPEEFVEQSHRTSYKVCVLCPREHDWQFYRVPLRERLPTIRIPLRESDTDVPLDLQALVEACYRKGAYDDDIDYKDDPIPPLDEADTRWADELLRKKRRRTRPSEFHQTPKKRGKRSG